MNNWKKNFLPVLALKESKTRYSNQYNGFQFNIAGRLRGAQRARKLQFYYGCISPQTFRSSMSSHKKQIFTKWGTWGSTTYISRSS